MRISAQSETSYDIEHECICLIDSIAPDTIVQFWRFTQSNNPGEYTVDVTFDFSGAYLPSGTLLSCKDYYLEDNPGGSGTANTLAMWTGPSSLGNSSVTQSGQILSSSFTGALKPPAGTTVQQPVGSPGYFRFNTTASGFEGYNGSAYRFLPWASADNFTSAHIPYSDGNQLTSTANLTWDNANGIVYAGVVKSGDLEVTLDIRPTSSSNDANVSVGTSYNHAGASPTANIVAVGANAQISSGTQSTAVGADAISGDRATAVGQGANAASFSTSLGRSTSTTSAGSLAVGSSATTNATNKPTAIGGDASCTGQWGVSVGAEAAVTANNSVAFGGQASTSHTGCIAVGRNAITTATGQAVMSSFNSSTNGIENVYFGSGVQRNAISDGDGVSYTINGSGGRGTNFTGGKITVAGGKGTGTGAPGDITFSTSDAGASGSTLQTLAERVWIKGETGQLSVGTSSPNASALVQVESTTQGFLPPRMTTAQRDAIASPTAGLVIFNTTTTKLECYDGATWQAAW